MDENKIIKTELTLQEWNMIIGALVHRPFQEVAGIINKLNGLIQPQLQEQFPATESKIPPPAVNV